MKKQKKTRTSIMLPDDVLKLAKKKARENNQTLSGYFTTLVQERAHR